MPKHTDDRGRSIAPKSIGGDEKHQLSSRARFEAARRAIESPPSIMLHRAGGAALTVYAIVDATPDVREVFMPNPRYTAAEVAIPVLFWAAVAVGGVFLAVRARLVLRRSYEAVQKRAIPTPHACLQCGYDLLGLPREEDGCAVCPECGAAWRPARAWG